MYKQFRDTDYEANEEGIIRNRKTKHVINQYYKSKKEHDYKYVELHIDGEAKHYRVHRVVLEAFTEKHDELEVNHKNCIRDDNRLSNLEWVTKEGNFEHALINAKNMSQRKPVVGINIKTKEYIEFISLYQAGKYISGSKIEKEINHYSSLIKASIKGGFNVYGYKWVLLEDFNPDKIEDYLKKKEKYTEYQKEMMEKNNLTSSMINRRVKLYKMSVDEAVKYPKGHKFVVHPSKSIYKPDSKHAIGLGKRFNNLITMEIIREKGKSPQYKCQCDCGKVFITQCSNVLLGKTKSCGCNYANHT